MTSPLGLNFLSIYRNKQLFLSKIVVLSIFTIVLCELYYKLYFSPPAILRTVLNLCLLKYQQSKETTLMEICEEMFVISISEQDLVL